MRRLRLSEEEKNERAKRWLLLEGDVKKFVKRKLKLYKYRVFKLKRFFLAIKKTFIFIIKNREWSGFIKYPWKYFVRLFGGLSIIRQKRKEMKKAAKKRRDRIIAENGRYLYYRYVFERWLYLRREKRNKPYFLKVRRGFYVYVWGVKGWVLYFYMRFLVLIVTIVEIARKIRANETFPIEIKIKFFFLRLDDRVMFISGKVKRIIVWFIRFCYRLGRWVYKRVWFLLSKCWRVVWWFVMFFVKILRYVIIGVTVMLVFLLYTSWLCWLTLVFFWQEFRIFLKSLDYNLIKIIKYFYNKFRLY